MHFRTATRKILENAIEKPYQSKAKVFSDKVFGIDTPKHIIANLKVKYGVLQIEEITANMKKLLDPFDQNKPIKELIKEI